ncbi:hypothetical protein QIA17_05150 (plasmid) [Borreliella californiensis]|uniref:Uncharacterized protein n=1 Tax=Borreliella californiensis TaxID=373543 RepID=A0A7X0DPU2_9SPIR|nr:hypothetical protein [Borreliella californiensis]MBB6213526.1 hypothetical protein [Borreliella californiensis]MBB6213539.1 hypothetical protein [Borreliella californiensis]
MNKKMFIIYVVFVLINYCKDFLHLYYLDNSEQDVSKELINKRLDNYDFENENENDINFFLPMLHKLEGV